MIFGEILAVFGSFEFFAFFGSFKRNSHRFIFFGYSPHVPWLCDRLFSCLFLSAELLALFFGAVRCSNFCVRDVRKAGVAGF